MQPRPCKFGTNCNNFAKGHCNFYHAPSSQGGFGHFRSNTSPNNNPNYGGNQPNRNQGGNQFNPGYRNNQPNPNYNGGYNGNKPYNNPNYTGGFKGQGMNVDDSVERQFCRMFQMNDACKHGEKCRYKHAFLANKEDTLLRLQFTRAVPNHPICRLTKFKSGGKDFFAMRNGVDVNFFDFNFETKILGDVFKYSLPDPNGKYNFYDHKNEFIYYSKENEELHYEDMGVYDLQKLKNYFVANSHQGKITGIAHFKDNVLVSSSMNGELKVWLLQGDQLQCHQESTQRLRSSFNPQNAKLELYFVDISQVAGTKIITVGTSDGRLLFWIGQGLDYKQVQLNQLYSRVFKVRYTTRQEVPTAVILTWNHNKTHSAVLEIDLTNFTIRPLVEVKTTEDQPKNIINVFEFIHGYLMIANMNGLLSIYGYPDTSQKLGVIMHQNQLSDIIASEDELKNTNIKVKTMFILEKKTEQRDGSLGIYLFK